MKFVQNPAEYTLEVKQSKFIAHLVPFTQFEMTLKTLRKEHPKARHFVVAWRYINEYDQIVEHCSDDGEPKGTSGKPTLAVLSGMEMINTAVIIVRYFGGTKLGTGGLVRAYSDACNGVLSVASLETYVKKDAVRFHVDYPDISVIEYRMEEQGISAVEKVFDEKGCLFFASAQEQDLADFLHANARLICIKR